MKKFDISETENEIALTLPKFSCDVCLGKHIPKPLPSMHHFMTFCGPPGSGKTSLFLGLLTSKGDQKVYRGVDAGVYMCLHFKKGKYIYLCPDHSVY